MKAKAGFFSFIGFVFFLQIFLVSATAATIRIMPLGDSITAGYTGSPDAVGYRRSLYLSLVDAGQTVDFVGSLADGIPGDFDKDHEGHSGWEANQIRDGVYSWLVLNPADIVLLHIGTNDIDDDQSAAAVRDEINQILNVIDDYEDDSGIEVIVILARIINRQDPFTLKGLRTTALNGLLQTLIDNRLASGDKIRVADHESALDYPDDMNDLLHPNMTGYEKMADVWFSALLEDIFPAADAGSNQSVDEGETVTLDGSNSNDPPFNPISDYFWEQTGGKPVTISDPAVVQPTFTAPDAGSQGETLTFRLTVNYSDNFESSDTTIVMVNGHSSSSSSSGCFIGTAANGLLMPYGTKFK